MSYDLDRLRQVRGQVAIVGVGETDYAADYRAGRTGETRQLGDPGTLDSYGLAVRAFKRALDDSGLRKEDIDGVAVGGPVVHQRVCEILGINPIWGGDGAADLLIPQAVQAIASGACNTVALIYGNAQRSMGTLYGGSTVTRDQPTSYYYYHPWGWSSQGAHYAMMFKAHQLLYGSTEEQLGAVAVTLRKHAVLNENAVMRDPLTIDDYMESRYICRPLHIFDFCLVNDGGVALILRRADMAQDLPRPPVLVSGFGRATAEIGATQLRDRMFDLYHAVLKASGDQCFAMAEMTTGDVDHFQTYDAFSIHLPINLEGFGFCEPGEGMEYIQDGRIEIGGELPCNTSGSMLSESYMQSWNHMVEAVRQLRHEAGARQVEGVETSMYCHHGSGGAYSIMYQRGT